MAIQSKPTNTSFMVNDDPQGNSTGGAQGPGAVGTSSDEAMLTTLLRDYEKAKAAITQALMQNTTEAHISDLKNSALGQTLSGDPVWTSLVSSQGASGSQGPEFSSGDVKNFFFLIFKFLRDHRDTDSRLEAAQAASMVTQSALLDNLTHESTESLDSMKEQIHKAEKKADSPLAKFLKIGLPILLVFITLIISVATLGTGAGAAASLDAAITAGAEAGVEAGIETGMAAGLDAALQASVEGTAEGAAEGAGTGVTQVTEQSMEKTMTAVIKAAVEKGVAEAGKDATNEVVQAAVQKAVTEAVQQAVKEGIVAIAQQGGDVAGSAAADAEAFMTNAANAGLKAAMTPATFAENMAATGVTSAIKQAIVNNPVVQAMGTTIGKIGLAGAAAMAGVTGGVCNYAGQKPTQDETNAMQEATTTEQGVMSINSAANDAVENTLKQGMQTVQTAESDQESTSSLYQQMIQSMTKILYVGNY